MNHNDFVKKVAAISGKPVTETDKVVRATLQAIANELRTAGGVSLLGLGKLSCCVKAAHKGRNPRTGASVDVPERQVVRFKASSVLVL